MLPSVLARWRVRYLADGLALSPPEGRALGGVRIRERQSLRSARDVIGWARAQLDGCDQVTVGPLERLITCEGEHAAVFTVAGARGAAATEHTVGIVWGDYFCAQIDGATDDAASFVRFRQVVRAVTSHHALGLGELRRRRFAYHPPVGWRPYPRGLIAEWYPADFPSDHGLLSVFPARPAKLVDPAGELDRLFHEMSWFGFTRQSPDASLPLVTDAGMAGHLWTLLGRFDDGPLLCCSVAVLGDGRFQYVLRLEAKPDNRERHERTFAEVVRSIEPVPMPADPSETAMFAHWMS